jgi:hypothetical protein
MAWDAGKNTWTTPGNTFDAYSLWEDYLKQNPSISSLSGLEKQKAFNEWWGTGGGGAAWRSAWGAEYAPWQETITGQMNDPDRPQGSFSGRDMPVAPSFTGLQTSRDTQLYGAEGDEGLYGLMNALAKELAGGSGQYNDEWSSAYAEQAGFDTPEARDKWLQEQRAQQTALQDQLAYQAKPENAMEISPEQQKLIRGQQREQEAKARKQAEAMYQETGSYAVLQRASDELNRASVNDALKSQMEMALQNYSTTLSAVGQQTETLMREVEAGTQSFKYYVDAKQTGITNALVAYQAEAEGVLRQYEQNFNAVQTGFSNDLALYTQAETDWKDAQDAWNAQYDQMVLAAAAAMGGANVSEAELNYYNEMITTLANEANTDTLIETAGDEHKGANAATAGGAVLVAIGFIMMVGFGWTGVGAIAGATIAGSGATMFATNVGKTGAVETGGGNITPESTGGQPNAEPNTQW